MMNEGGREDDKSTFPTKQQIPNRKKADFKGYGERDTGRRNKQKFSKQQKGGGNGASEGQGDYGQGGQRQGGFSRQQQSGGHQQAGGKQQGGRGSNARGAPPWQNPPQRGRFERNKGMSADRPRWTPVKMSEEAIPTPLCPVCGQTITELALAFSCKTPRGESIPQNEGETAYQGEVVHFECAREDAGRGVELGAGDVIAYIGGGRFAVVHYPHAQNCKNYAIKKIIEWEKREERTAWRQLIADHFSRT